MPVRQCVPVWRIGAGFPWAGVAAAPQPATPADACAEPQDLRLHPEMLATSPAESPIDMLDLATWRDDHAIRAIDLQRTNRQARCIG